MVAQDCQICFKFIVWQHCCQILEISTVDPLDFIFLVWQPRSTTLLLKKNLASLATRKEYRRAHWVEYFPFTRTKLSGGCCCWIVGGEREPKRILLLRERGDSVPTPSVRQNNERGSTRYHYNFIIILLNNVWDKNVEGMQSSGCRTPRFNMARPHCWRAKRFLAKVSRMGSN